MHSFLGGQLVMNNISVVIASGLVLVSQASAALADQPVDRFSGVLIAAAPATKAGAAAPDKAQTDASLPKTLKFMGKSLEVKNNQRGPSGEFIAEYIPAGETWDNWTSMYACRLLPGVGLDPEASAKATAAKIMERKQGGDPVANAAVFKQNDGKSVAVDFLVSQGPMLEHNVFLYYSTPKGLASKQYARRLYGGKGKTPDDTVKTFIMGIPQMRAQILKELQGQNAPMTAFAK